MSINLSIKGVPDAWAQRLRERAAQHHRSLQGELMALLGAAVGDEATPMPVQSARMPAARTAGLAARPLSVDEAAQRARGRFGADPVASGRSTDILRALRDEADGR
ncbi:MAG: FitA-like ribbon-helix-helix domain-containing protein [Aquincola tertiaricarbonis]